MVEHFEHDGRRYYIALRNDPVASSLTSLTEESKDVADLVAQGLSNRDIGESLGKGLSAIGSSAQRMLPRLRIESRVELAVLAGHIQRFLLPVGDSDVAILHIAEAEIQRCFEERRLTAAERDVTLRVLRGQSNKDICGARGTKERTVAEQIQRIFDKFGVCTRAQLAAVLTRAS